jgi:hypothetical protein
MHTIFVGFTICIEKTTFRMIHATAVRANEMQTIRRKYETMIL